MILLSPSDVRHLGLSYLTKTKLWKNDKSVKRQEFLFKKFYGSNAFQLATVWYDQMTTCIPEAKLTKNEISYKGFKYWMAAHFFLAQYPKNAEMICKDFDISRN